MGVFSTPDGRWYVQWSEAGKRHKKYFGHGDLAKAQAGQFDTTKKRERGKLQIDGVSIAMLCQMYDAGHLVEDTTAGVNFYRFQLLIKAFGKIQAEHLSTQDLNKYINQRLAAGMKRATIAREIGLLKAVYSWAESQDPAIIVRNPIAKFKLPRASDKDVPMPPSPAEIKAIVDRAEPHLARAITIMWFTGIRPGPKELLHLTWGDVDLSSGLIRVAGARKGGPVIRYVPIPEQLKVEMERWLDGDKKQHGQDVIQGLNVVHYLGKPVLSLKRSWDTAKKRVGVIRRLRLYDLRHAMVSTALSRGADLKSVSEVIGHSRPDTTLREYQHVTRDQHRQVVDLIPGILGGSLGAVKNKDGLQSRAES